MGINVPVARVSGHSVASARSTQSVSPFCQNSVTTRAANSALSGRTGGHTTVTRCDARTWLGHFRFVNSR